MSDSSKSATAGAVSGMTARVITTPLDVIKIRFQLQLEPVRGESRHVSKYRGVLQAISNITKEEGFTALWKGMTPGLSMYVLYGSIQFSCYDYTTKLLQNQFNFENKIACDFIGGSIGGSTATCFCQPLDVLRTRLASQGEPKYYKNVRNGVIQMYREGGVRTFYKGFLPALLIIFPQAGMQFGFYSFYKTIWRSLINDQVNALYNFHLLICGGLAGVSSKIICLPLDTVKKRLEVQGFDKPRRAFGSVGHYVGVRDAFRKILKEESVFGFYKGTLPTLLKTSLTTSLSFFTYELVLEILH